MVLFCLARAVLSIAQKIHKKLEKKVKPVEVEIKASTNTERWALRCVRTSIYAP